MNTEHKTTPIEHWIVDGKAYRLATEADVGKECFRSDTDIELAISNGRCELVAFRAGDEYPYVFGTEWKYAYIQDDSLLASQRTPVPALGDGWFLLTAEDGEWKKGDMGTAGGIDIGWVDASLLDGQQVNAWLGRGCLAARYFGPANEPQPAIESEPQPKSIDWTKPVRTKDGRAVRVLCTDGPGDYPVVGFIDGVDGPDCWHIDGRYFESFGDDRDLENAPQRIQADVWVNVYPNGNYYTYRTREAADKDVSSRFACVKITIDCEEGEGL